jgi:hypothetical protein
MCPINIGGLVVTRGTSIENGSSAIFSIPENAIPKGLDGPKSITNFRGCGLGGLQPPLPSRSPSCFPRPLRGLDHATMCCQPPPLRGHENMRGISSISHSCLFKVHFQVVFFPTGILVITHCVLKENVDSQEFTKFNQFSFLISLFSFLVYCVWNASKRYVCNNSCLFHATR